MRDKYGRTERQILREKAIQLRAFDDNQSLALLKEYQGGGVTMKELAQKHGRATETIRKTINRAKRLSM
jgi:transposase-like protein